MPFIADPVVVIGEERRVIADGRPAEILTDRELLVRANLMHDRLHPRLGTPGAVTDFAWR